MTFRDRRFLDLAHEMRTCQVQIPGVCQGESPEGLEPAHGNWQWLGRGVGHKATDIFAAACPACHRALDVSAGSTMFREAREEYWQRGAIRTMLYMLEHGWLTISPTRVVNGRR